MSSEVFSFQIDSPYEEDIKFLTVISESEGGKEQRYQKWLKPRRTFRLQLRARGLNPSSALPQEAKQIWDFYSRHKGSFDSFYFQNPSENPVTGEIVGSGDGARSVFYLGQNVYIGTGDLIVTPGSAVLTRSVRGTGDYLPFSAYSITDSLGQIQTNPVLPSGDILKATYNFRYRVRFKEDILTRETFVSTLCDYGLELEEVI
jgi:hypothetical protein